MEIQSGFSIIRPDQAPRREQPEKVDARQKEPVQSVEGIVVPEPVRSSQSDDVLNSAKKFQQQTGYDQPEGKGQQATAAYQSLEREAQRDSIRQLLGVDIYA
ncbi:hypothetical protein Q4520_19725 [Alteromonas sp. 1_MG-2023]|uniref:hypothetical protein n=1 Tax=unclassified Alteromonas TaxID=2614992 RepID=UPI0026E46C24|nr:hypothetical protein [Alteromonas sp. 1_MG-2023]MDO6477659.1 hypothetical protein [Alteromonas sp. 1_MG-2023]